MASGGITLKIVVQAKNVTRSMRFTPEMSVHDALKEINEKLAADGATDHALFQRAVGTKSPARWLDPHKTLAFYDLHHEDEVIYRKKTRVQKIKMLDGSVKTIFVDDSKPSRDAVETVCGKLDIKTSEEYGFMIEGKESWLKMDRSLFEQEIEEDTILVLKKRFFFFDANIDKSDPRQVHVLYTQILDFIVEGKYLCQRDEAVMLSAVAAQIKWGDCQPQRFKDGKEGKENKKEVKGLLPPQWRLQKKIFREILIEWKKLAGTSEINAKYRYIQIARALKTFGMTTFAVKIKKGRDLKEEFIGISRDSLVRMDGETKEVIKTYQLKHVKRFASTEKSVTIDFGDYEEEYYNAITHQGRDIASLISGYIDIIMRIRRDSNSVVDEDDTQTAEVDIVARAPGRGTAMRGVASAHAPHGSFSGLGDGGQAGRHARTKSKIQAQDILLDDIAAAIRAADLLSDELACAPSPMVHQTAMTPEQWRQQLIVSYQGVAGTCGELLKNLSGGVVGTRAAMIEAAKNMMTHALKMGTAAKFANGEAGGLSLLDATRNVAESLSAILKLTDSLKEGTPLTPEQMQALQEANERYTAAQAYLEAVISGKGVIDPFSRSLLMQCGCELAQAAADLQKETVLSAQLVTDEDAKKLLLEEADNTYTSAESTESVVGALGGAIIVPQCKAQLTSNIQRLQRHLASYLSAAKTSKLTSDQLEPLLLKARGVSDAIATLLQSVECAEHEGNVPVEIVAEFSAAAMELNASLDQLRASVGDGQQIVSSFRAVAGAVNKAVARSRQIAATSDAKAQQGLLAAAKAIADSITRLAQASKASAEKPVDKTRQNEMISAATSLQSVTQQMISDVGRVAAASSIRLYAKTLVAKGAAFVGTLHANESSIPDSLSKAVATSTTNLNEAMKSLLVVVRMSAKDPFNSESQLELMDSAQKSCVPAMQLVAATARCLPRIRDMEIKQCIQIPSDECREAVQGLLKACSAFKELGGEAAVEEVSEELGALIAEIETTEAMIQSGTLERTPGKAAKDEALAMLYLAAKQLTTDNEALLNAPKMDSRALQMHVRSASGSTSQVLNASRAVASTFMTKAAQGKLVSVSKQLVGDVQVLVTAARASMLRPEDAATGEALTMASQSVATDLANLTSCEVDSKEIDEALDLLERELSRIAVIRPADGTTKQQAMEELVSASKALSGGVTQVVQMARLNPKGLGAAAKLTATTVPAVVHAACVAAGVGEPEQAPLVIETTNQTVRHLQGVLTLAKALAANPQHEGHERNLIEAAKLVASAMQRLLNSLGSANKEIEESIEVISRAADRLIGGPAEVQALTIPQAVRELTKLSRSLMEHSAGVVSSARTDSGALGRHAASGAADVAAFVEVVRSMVAGPEPFVPQKYMEPSEQLRTAVSLLVGGVENADRTRIIDAMKLVASGSKAILHTAGDDSMRLEGEERADKLVDAGQQLQSATGLVARSAKAYLEGDPTSPEALLNAAGALDAANERIVAAATVVPTKTEILPKPQCEALIAGAQSVSVATSQLLTNGMALSGHPRDKDLQSNLAESALAMSESVKAVLKTASGVIAGAGEVEASVDSIQALVEELAGAAMAAAVGSMSSTGTSGSSSGLSRQIQDELVAGSREVQSSIQQLMTSAHGQTSGVGQAAQRMSAVVDRVSKLVQQAAQASSDQDMQSDVINAAKDLADSSARLISSTFAYACNQGKDDMAEAARANGEASQAIGKIVSRLAAGTELLKDLDVSISTLKSAVRASGEGATPEPDRTYQDYKDDLISMCRTLTLGIKSLVASDKTNLVQVGNVAKQVAQLSCACVESMKCTASLAPTPEVSHSITTSGAALARATLSIAEAVKTMASDPKNKASQKQLNDSFRDATASIAALMKAAKDGAVGEVMCDEAVAAIRKTIEDVDAALLFSSAGQLEDTSGGLSAAELQKRLSETSESLSEAGGSLAHACGGSQQELGEAAQEFGKLVAELGQQVCASASQIRDISVQQELLSTGKSACISAQALVLAGKDAQRFKGEKTDRVLAASLDSTVAGINGLVKTSQTALAELARGAKALEEARASVSNLIQRFDSMEGNAEATPKFLVEATRAVLSASSQISHAISSGDQVGISRAAHYMQEAGLALLRDSKGCMRLTNSASVTGQLRKSVLAISEKEVALLQAARDAASSDEPAARQALEAAAADLAKLTPNVNDAIKQLPGGEGLEIDQDKKDSDDLEHLAERELEKAARAIEDAAARLLASRPKVEAKAPGVKLDLKDINAIIIDGAHAIAIATSSLVKHASVCQSRRLENAKSGSVRYRADPLWSNGLISAAQGVVGSVHSLVGSANKEKPDEEELVVTARNVASATAHLVTASKVKADDPNSADQQNLSASARAVAAATSKLVAAAKQALEVPAEVEESSATVDLSAVAQRNRELEYQIEIEKLEKQKEQLRRLIQKGRKDKYADGSGSSPQAVAGAAVISATRQSAAFRRVSSTVGVDSAPPAPVPRNTAPAAAPSAAAPSPGQRAAKPPPPSGKPAPPAAVRPPPPVTRKEPSPVLSEATPPPPAPRPSVVSAPPPAADDGADVPPPPAAEDTPPPPPREPRPASQRLSKPPPPAVREVPPPPAAREVPPPPVAREVPAAPAADAADDNPPPPPRAPRPLSQRLSKPPPPAAREVPLPPTDDVDDVPPPADIDDVPPPPM